MSEPHHHHHHRQSHRHHRHHLHDDDPNPQNKEALNEHRELLEHEHKRAKCHDEKGEVQEVDEKLPEERIRVSTGEKAETGKVHKSEHIVGWTSLFTKTRAAEICHRKLFTVKSNDTVAHLLQVLSDKNIISCPVIDPSTDEFLGFVDTLDVAGWVLTSWRKHSRELEHGKFPSREFFHEPVEKILNYSKVDPAVAVNEHISILDLVDVFTDPHTYHRLHRVAVVDGKKNILGIISQSDLISFAFKNIHLLPRELAAMKIRELNIGRSLIFVRLDSPFIDTLETLYQNRISGLALVDEEFHLSGNISTSDLRGISPASFDYFLGSTLQFLVKGQKGPIKPPTSVSFESTLEDVLKILYENRIHRVYLTNEYDRPQSVITLGDLIARLI